MIDLQSGDLIAVSGKGLVSNIIQMGTVAMPNVGPLGRWGMAGMSHVGVVAHVCPPGGGRAVPLVYESTSFARPPCVRTSRPDPKGVQAHHLQSIIDAGGDVFHYPLKRPLYFHEEDRLLVVLEECLGRDYDFFGAGTAWGGLLRWAARKCVSKENLATMFCSELVAHAWAQIGLIATPSASVWSPTRLVRYAVHTGVCRRGILIS